MDSAGTSGVVMADSDVGPDITTDDEHLAGLGVLLDLSLLLLSMVIGALVKRSGASWLSQASVALLIGLFAGLLVRSSLGVGKYSEWIGFKQDFFFLFLLPPIIFESGFTLNKKHFFNNFMSICVFAFYGTLVSTLIVGAGMFVCSELGLLAHSMTLLECLIFGALISATDPVTVLAIFNELKVTPNMYMLVFGESVLNDAVAIVLYRTLMAFMITRVDAASLMSAVLTFCVIFVGSMGVGTITGLASAVLFKHNPLGAKAKHITTATATATANEAAVAPANGSEVAARLRVPAGSGEDHELDPENETAVIMSGGVNSCSASM